MAKVKPKAKIIIAGPGAGKTHNMVASIISALPELSPCRYLAVITYTNSATNNIVTRLAKKITIPDNLFIGTMHSFLNRFLVIPYASFISEPVKQEKLFMQCGLDDVFSHVEKMKAKDKKKKTPQEVAVAKAAIRKRLNKLGYITFDQTLSIAGACMLSPGISSVVANRLQFLFVDEFQDSGNQVYHIVETIRKQGKTKIYCVGDPEQYIQSFDSTIRNFAYIPILKASVSTGYDVEINNGNYRSTERIVSFLNNFNGRTFGKEKFGQVPKSKDSDIKISPIKGELVCFITKHGTVKPMIDDFYTLCKNLSIHEGDRCIIAKRKEVIQRIVAAVNNKYKDPKKTTSVLPIKAIQDSLLTTLQMNVSEFCEFYKTDTNTLRKYAIAIFKAIRDGVITNENTFALFVTDKLKLTVKAGLPVKIDNLKFDIVHEGIEEVVTVSTIHTIKGLDGDFGNSRHQIPFQTVHPGIYPILRRAS